MTILTFSEKPLGFLPVPGLQAAVVFGYHAAISASFF